MRFDPGYYDNMGPMGNRKRGGSFQLRKADKRWVRPAEQEADLTKAKKETRVTFDGSHDPVAMVIYRNCSGNF